MDSKTQPEFDYRIKRSIRVTDKYDHSYRINLEVDDTEELVAQTITCIRGVMLKHNLTWESILLVEVI